MKRNLKTIVRNNRKAIWDVILNISANAIPIATLQLVVYPITANVLGSERYGLMITIYSLWMVVSYSLGNVLNNIRLLNNNYYEEADQQGDFRILLTRWNTVNAVAIVILTIIYYDNITAATCLVSVFIAILFLLKSYLEVGFRITLNYIAICISNVLQALGFLVGCFITYKTGYWQSIFLLGYLFSCVYAALKTGILSEPRCKTPLFPKVRKEVNELTLATVVGCLSDYADKLILYPLMGGYTVSIYYTATILGKIVGMLTGPINAVVLSYISRWKQSRKNTLNAVLMVAAIVAIIGYFMTLLISRPFLGFLFPQWVDEVLKYIPVTTITVCLSIIVTIIQPFVLKFCDIKWQILISSIGLGTYFCASLLLWKFFGLMGFCYGTVIGISAKLLFILYVYYKKGNNGEEAQAKGSL